MEKQAFCFQLGEKHMICLHNLITVSVFVTTGGCLSESYIKFRLTGLQIIVGQISNCVIQIKSSQ